MKEASIILRYSNKSTKRERNLRVLLDFISRAKNLEIILVVMENDIDIKNPNVIKKFYDIPFESSKANNIGANLSTTPTLMLQDADVLFKLGHYNTIIKLLKEYDSIRVGNDCSNIGEFHMKRLASGPNFVDEFLNKKHGCLRDAPGAMIAITKKKYIEIGGYCELFKVYGWEDCYFRHKVNKLTQTYCLNEQVLHLPHEVNYQAGKQPINAPLYHDLLYTDDGDCVKLSQRDKEFLLENYKNLRRFYDSTKI